ncbi:MAG: hypothetical protein ACE5HW_06785 [Candidatus Methanofastidiosia archaeon]
MSKNMITILRMISSLLIGLSLIFIFHKYFWVLIWGGFWVAAILSFKVILTTDLNSYEYGTWIPKKINLRERKGLKTKGIPTQGFETTKTSPPVL